MTEVTDWLLEILVFALLVASAVLLVYGLSGKVVYVGL